jgi:hypothetical protein
VNNILVSRQKLPGSEKRAEEKSLELFAGKLPRRIFDFRVPHVVVERVVGDLDVTKRAEHAQLKIKCYRTYELLLNTILKID